MYLVLHHFWLRQVRVSVILCCVCMHEYMSRVFTFYSFLVVTRRVIYSQSSSRHWLSACFQEQSWKENNESSEKLASPSHHYCRRSSICVATTKIQITAEVLVLFLACWLAILIQVEKKVSVWFTWLYYYETTSIATKHNSHTDNEHDHYRKEAHSNSHYGLWLTIYVFIYFASS